VVADQDKRVAREKPPLPDVLPGFDRDIGLPVFPARGFVHDLGCLFEVVDRLPVMGQQIAHRLFQRAFVYVVGDADRVIPAVVFAKMNDVFLIIGTVGSKPNFAFFTKQGGGFFELGDRAFGHPHAALVQPLAGPKLVDKNAVEPILGQLVVAFTRALEMLAGDFDCGAVGENGDVTESGFGVIGHFANDFG